MINVLTVSGSLRAASSNTTLLAAAAHLAPGGVSVSPYTALSALPAFNPDVEESDGALPSVTHWRNAVKAADAVLLSSPEYAHGIPGALKNALDWMVGSGELVAKPVGVLSASTYSTFVHPQLVEVLTVMSATIVPEATIVLDVPRRGFDVAQISADTALATVLRNALSALARAAERSAIPVQ